MFMMSSLRRAQLACVVAATASTAVLGEPVAVTLAGTSVGSTRAPRGAADAVEAVVAAEPVAELAPPAAAKLKDPPSIPPVVLVPGLTGSVLEARLTDAPMPEPLCKTNTYGEWFVTWIEVQQALPFAKQCLVQRLTLFVNTSDGTYLNAPGVEIRPADFGGAHGIDFIDPRLSITAEFVQMMDHLTNSLQYRIGENMHGAPYDWRLAGDAHSNPANGVGGFYADLQKLIEETVKRNGRRAVVISHSLGCPTTLYFFNRYVSEEWRAEYIESWVALAGAWMGGAAQAACYLGGDTLGVPTWAVPHDYVKKVQVKAASGMWLSPHPQAFGNRTILVTPSRNYTAADVPELISTIGEQAGGEETLAIFGKKSIDLGQVQYAPVNVPVLNWHSSGVETREWFEYSKDVVPGFNEAPSRTHNGDGDGSVNLLSLKWPEQWPVASNAHLTTREFPGVSHFDMLTDANVLEALTQYLSGILEPVYV